MYCEQCGQKNTEDARFCEKCGHQFKEEPSQQTITPSQEQHINQPSNRNKTNWLGIASAVIGFIFMVSIVGWLFSDSSSESGTNNSSYSSTPIKSQSTNEQRKVSSYNRVAETVVNIMCPYSSEPFSLESDGTGGSGTIIDSSGLIISNSHIIPQDEYSLNVSEGGCFVVLPDTETGAPSEIYLATPLVFNELSDEYDLAFLTIYDVYVDEYNYAYGEYPKDFSSFDDSSFCENDEIRLGESIRILGYPVSSGGYNLTITEGIVSSFTDEGFILTSAKIDQGNSGGLAIDDNGCMIGIPTAVSFGEYETLGVIIPPYDLVEFIEKVSEQIN